MGDRSTDYRLLKKVISTCAAANYGQVSLAVNQVASRAVDGAAMAASAE